MTRKKRELPPMCRPAMRISITLTVGQAKAIEQSVIFELVGRSHQKVVKHWMTNGVIDYPQPGAVAALPVLFLE